MSSEPHADADVIIVGAGPTGLMLACELRLAGVRPLILERQSRPASTPKAERVGGQILNCSATEDCSNDWPRPAPRPSSPPPRFPFGGVHLDFTELADPPLRALQLPQAQLERVLEERARALGTEIRRGHEVVGQSQNDTSVIVEVCGPDGAYQVTAGYFVGCDGAHSRVRHLAELRFPARPIRRSTVSPRWPFPTPLSGSTTATSRPLDWEGSLGVHQDRAWGIRTRIAHPRCADD